MGYNIPDVLPSPALEDAENDAFAYSDTFREANEIEGEINDLHRRNEIGQQYVTEKEQSGKLQIAPEEITPEEMKIILAFSDSLLEGTGAQYSTVMPSAESAMTPAVALESLKEALTDLLAAAAALLEKLWDKITDYWTLFIHRIGSLVNTSKEIKRVAENRLGQSSNTQKLKLTRSRYFEHLRYQGKYPSDFQKLESNFQALLDNGGSTLTVWGREVIDAGSNAVSALNHGNKDDMEGLLDQQNKIAADLWAHIPEKYYDGVPLMGAKTLKVEESDYAPQGDRPAEIAKLIQGLKLTLVSEQYDTVTDKIMFKTLRLEEIVTLQDMIIQMAEGLFLFLRQNKLPAMEKKTKAFVKDTQRQLNRIDEDETSEQISRRLVNYPVIFTEWVKNPALEISRLMVEVSRTIQMLCNESLSTY